MGNIKMKLSKSLVPILHKSEFDIVAASFLEQYYPQAIEYPMAVPIEDIAIKDLSLHIKRVHLSEDLSVLGQIFFSAGRAEIYVKESDDFIYETVDKGTMFIDPDVAVERNAGSERNTITHECVHWYIHRQYHMVQILAGGEKAVACKCPTKPPSEQFQSKWSDEDWMEWQADGIAPRILMPKNAFSNYVNAHPHYIEMQVTSRNAASIHLDVLINDLRKAFDVSRQSASIRLSELDLI